ncbi:hypothetical protein JY97_10745 [Alkalispirochaeta odontotermitis]|nr:hypothetical protein JY97_10745 [Alkalispirochaeta odontotermitis]
MISLLRKIIYQASHIYYHQPFPNGKRSPNSSYGPISLNHGLLIEQSFNLAVQRFEKFYLPGREENSLPEEFAVWKDFVFSGLTFEKLHGSADETIVPHLKIG